MFLLWITALIAQSAAQNKCFIAASSSVPRQMISTEIATSSCEAVQFNAARNECTILGPFLASNQCSAPYTAYEKRPNAECGSLPKPRSFTDGYSPGSCSTASDVIAPQKVMIFRPCGNFTIGQGRVVFDAILHNGTHLFLENYDSATVSYDSILGSFLYLLKGTQFYFKSGTCVRVPSQAPPGCECDPSALPSEPPIAGYKDAGVAPVVDVTPMCTSSLAQLRLKRFAVNSSYVEVVSTDSRSLFCAMGVWMTIVHNATMYNEYAVAAVTCVEPA